MTPTLIACSHGTSSEIGRAAIRSIVDDVRALLPEIRVVEAFVDVQEPAIDDVVAAETADGTAVVVPLLLSTGYHTRVDIARAVAASRGRATATVALGPHPLLVDILADRLDVIDRQPTDAVVLAAAGSSEPQSADDVRATATMLGERLGAEVVAAFAASALPALDTAVTAARSAGAAHVVAASYVLAPGHFAGVIERCGVDAATATLAPDPRLAQIVVDRFIAARAALG